MYGIDPGPGVHSKVFNAHLDRLLETGQFNPDILPHLSEFQQRTINEVKKALNRIKSKYARQTFEDTSGTESPQITN